MKQYSNQYRNQSYLYTVYREAGGTDYILVAVVPGVGWWDIAMHLSSEEIETLRRSEDEFTKIVDGFLYGRESRPYKKRRIEHLLKNINAEEIGLKEEGDLEFPSRKNISSLFLSTISLLKTLVHKCRSWQLTSAYKPAIIFSLVLQSVLFFFSALVLDGGQTLHIAAVAAVAYWAASCVIIIRRPISPTSLDLFLLRYGYVFIIIIVFFVGPFIWKALGRW